MNYRIASIDFKPPLVVSGSSDKHLRLLHITTLQGWSTSPEYDNLPPIVPYSFSGITSASSSSSISNNNSNGHHNNNNTTVMNDRNIICSSCGASMSVNGEEMMKMGGGGGGSVGRCVHGDLVRSVGLGEDYVFSGSYDLSIKVRFVSPLFLLSFALLAFGRGWNGRADGGYFRFGKGRRGSWLLILREDIRGGYFVLGLIVRRYVCYAFIMISLADYDRRLFLAVKIR
jgi:hypothetical protein